MPAIVLSSWLQFTCSIKAGTARQNFLLWYVRLQDKRSNQVHKIRQDIILDSNICIYITLQNRKTKFKVRLTQNENVYISISICMFQMTNMSKEIM